MIIYIIVIGRIVDWLREWIVVLGWVYLVVFVVLGYGRFYVLIYWECWIVLDNCILVKLFISNLWWWFVLVDIVSVFSDVFLLVKMYIRF